nr:MerR family transcriptional regulator [Actinomadura oligospora]
MQISELARRAGVTTKAVRYYESLGLLVPGRLANGYRYYNEHDVRLTREIRALADLGIPVERTRPFLECLTAGHRHADDCPASLAGYRDAIDELTQRIDGLTARRAVLVAHLHRAANRGSRLPPADEGEDLVTDYMNLPADLPVPEDDGAAAHLPGAKVPPLELQGTGGGSVRLDALGAGRTVIYIYPLTGRPGVDVPDGWDSIPGHAAAPPRPAASAITTRIFSLPARTTCTACRARRPTISVRSSSGFTCPSRCSPTLDAASPGNSPFPRSRPVGRRSTHGSP